MSQNKTRYQKVFRNHEWTNTVTSSPMSNSVNFGTPHNIRGITMAGSIGSTPQYSTPLNLHSPFLNELNPILPMISNTVNIGSQQRNIGQEEQDRNKYNAGSKVSDIEGDVLL